MLPDRPLPYCGAPPVPGALWSRWNLDPVLLSALILIAVGYGLTARRPRGPALAEQAAFYAGWAIAGLALVSPLCALSVSLFAARVGQHAVLTLVAAPLVAFGRPFATLGGRRAGAKAAGRAVAAAGVFAAALWFWHAPVPYAATFASPVIYWAMHLSLFGSALWLWSELIADNPAAAVRTTAAGLISTVQMGFLGALLTLAPRAFYAPHVLTTAAWGLSPLEDQQLGGAIMWVPGCLAFLAVSMLALARAFGRSGWSLGARGARLG